MFGDVVRSQTPNTNTFALQVERAPSCTPGRWSTVFEKLFGSWAGGSKALLGVTRCLLDGQNMVDVVSEGPYINAGQEIEVVEVRGNRIVVREA